MKRFHLISLIVSVLLASGCASMVTERGASQTSLDEQAVRGAVRDFFGSNVDCSQIDAVVNRLLAEQGRPDGFITGAESGGGFAVGVRHGRGTLHLANGETRELSWRGPSLGFTIGGHDSRVFVLVYDISEDATPEFNPHRNSNLHFVGRVGANFVGYMRGHAQAASGSSWNTAIASR